MTRENTSLNIYMLLLLFLGTSKVVLFVIQRFIVEGEGDTERTTHREIMKLKFKVTSKVGRTRRLKTQEKERGEGYVVWVNKTRAGIQKVNMMETKLGCP